MALAMNWLGVRLKLDMQIFTVKAAPTKVIIHYPFACFAKRCNFSFNEGGASAAIAFK